MLAEFTRYLPSLGTTVFAVISLLLILGDASSIRTVHRLVEAGDVMTVCPPMWTFWVRMIAIATALLVVLAVEVHCIRACRNWASASSHAAAQPVGAASDAAALAAQCQRR